jgi:hypothetical protein
MLYRRTRALPRNPARCTGAHLYQHTRRSLFWAVESLRGARELGSALILDMSLDGNLDSRQASAKESTTHVPLFQADGQPWEGGEHFFDCR